MRETRNNQNENGEKKNESYDYIMADFRSLSNKFVAYKRKSYKKT